MKQVLKFAKEVQGKIKQVPYAAPIAAGAAGFVIGLLVSSRILRQVIFMAGGYAVKEAVKSAPKDEIMNFAKRVLLDAIRHQPV